MPAKWVNVFTRHLSQKGHSLLLYDVDADRSRGLAERHNCGYTDSLHGATRDAEMVLLCTPITETPHVIHSIGTSLDPSTWVCEITSLKSRVVPALMRLKSLTLSLHPMFGPDVESFRGQTMVLAPVKDGAEEADAARMLFPETKLIQVSAESHDKAMAYALSLPYFMNLVFAHAIDPAERNMVAELAGTTFRAQSVIADCVAGESPRLIESLINENEHSWSAINQFIYEAKRLRRLLKEGTAIDDYLLELRESAGDRRLNEVKALRSSMIRKGDGLGCT